MNYIVGEANGGFAHKVLLSGDFVCKWGFCNQYQSHQAEPIRFEVYRITDDGLEKVQ